MGTTKRLAHLVVLLISFLAVDCIRTEDSKDVSYALYREKSLYFGNSFKLNWYKAYEYCRTRGMFLVRINNDEQLNDVVELVEKTGFTKANDELQLWTSGNDLGEEGHFYYASTGERLTYTRWRHNEPNNYKHDYCTYENCVIVEYLKSMSLNYTLDDRSCKTEYFFVCERLFD
ncbi:C-type lectin 37Da-like [Anopheles stephensi]|uniref:C-type lectin 37Da-like n=1 Tax=Anopheles stephensi TaxID=30069 RepID=UPI0007D4FD41|nr:C-type lectin 37Da-like [Anopheles stephensi]